MDGRLLAIGDIHGCYETFRELVENRLRLNTSDRLILLGDYVDRGYKSMEVISYILDLKNRGFDIVPLRGNHEAMLLDSVIDASHFSNWISNGGYSTLESYGIESVGEMPDEHLDFISGLGYYHCHGSYIFVHAGFNDGIEDPFQDTFQMIWSRGEHYFNPVFTGKVIIHGHTPVSLSECRIMVESGSRVLNLDTGCVYGDWGGYGHLTALEIQTGELFPVKYL